MSELSLQEAREQLWRQGILHWLLYPVQKELHQSYLDCKKKTVVWLCSRRLGKSSTLCILAMETCIRKKNALVKYCCPTQKMAREISREIITKMIETCPKDLQPKYKTMDNVWIFPNGSQIQLMGLDAGRAQNVRGGSSDLAIIDEAGMVDDLDNIVNSVIMATTLTTGGKIILASTPPATPDHPFIQMYVNTARVEGNLVTKTIYDNKNIDPSELQKIIDAYVGGVENIHFRREYLCEIIRDDNLSVIPEFTESIKKEIVCETKKPAFYDVYVAMDIGMKDLTVVLFAWYDFLNQKIVIEDEFVTSGAKFNTNTLAAGIRQKEEEHFVNPITKELITPYKRVSDNNLIVIKDLYDLYGLRFYPTRKDDADMALNSVRVMIQNKQISINPRCKVLIAHLENAIWNKTKTSFARSSDMGHYDAVDSLKYLIRNVNLHKNPYPAGHFKPNNPYSNPTDNTFKFTNQSNQQLADIWKNILNIKKK